MLRFVTSCLPAGCFFRLFVEAGLRSSPEPRVSVLTRLSFIMSLCCRCFLSLINYHKPVGSSQRCGFHCCHGYTCFPVSVLVFSVSTLRCPHEGGGVKDSFQPVKFLKLFQTDQPAVSMATVFGQNQVLALARSAGVTATVAVQTPLCHVT